MALLVGPDFELVINDRISNTYAHEVHEMGTSRQRLPTVAAAAAAAAVGDAAAVVADHDVSIGKQVEQDSVDVGAFSSAQALLKLAELEGGGSAAHRQPYGAGKQGSKRGGDMEAAEGPCPSKHFGDVKALEVRAASGLQAHACLLRM
jgi:hypothetical protein